MLAWRGLCKSDFPTICQIWGTFTGQSVLYCHAKKYWLTSSKQEYRLKILKLLSLGSTQNQGIASFLAFFFQVHIAYLPITSILIYRNCCKPIWFVHIWVYDCVFQGDQSRPRTEAGRGDTHHLSKTYWEHCIDLLRLLHCVWNLGGPGDYRPTTQTHKLALHQFLKPHLRYISFPVSFLCYFTYCCVNVNAQQCICDHSNGELKSI